MLRPEDVAALAAAVTGPVLLPGDDDFTRETATFNLSLMHRPALAIGASTPGDVQAAVTFAAEHQLPVAVLATGHGAVVSADGAVLINTSRMNGVRIDEESMTARVEAGVRWQQVIDEAAKVDLAPMAGSSPLVGVVAYHLGGGLSPVLGRPLGFASDYVRSLDLVTADGRLRHVTPETEPELFWALRGGKGNFGVVTAIEFDLFPVRTIYGGGLYFDGADIEAVLHAYRAWVLTVPDQMSSSVLLLRAPDLPVIPEPLRGKLVVHVRIGYLGSPEHGTEMIVPLRTAAPALIDTVAEIPFAAIAAIHNDPVDPLPVLERTALLWELSAEVVDRIVELAGPAATSPVMAVEIRHLGGALQRAPKVPSAVDNREAGFTVFAATFAGPDDAESAWGSLGRLIDGLRPWCTSGTYLNFMSSADTAPDAVRAAYRPDTYRRLLIAKQTYDPQNIFRINHNLRTEPQSGS